MIAQTKAELFLARAKQALNSTGALQGEAGSESDTLFLAHHAIEMGLKAALIKVGAWDGRARTFKKHDIEILASGLSTYSGSLPSQLLRDIDAASEVPRVGEGACESSAESRHADNLEWSAISLSDRLSLAERVLRYVEKTFFSESPAAP